MQIFTVLPNPPAQVMKDMVYQLLWDRKPDKIQRNVIINNNEKKGGGKTDNILNISVRR